MTFERRSRRHVCHGRALARCGQRPPLRRVSSTRRPKDGSGLPRLPPSSHAAARGVTEEGRRRGQTIGDDDDADDDDDDYDDDDDGFSADTSMVMSLKDLMDCIGCQACSRVCPKKCLSHEPAPMAA